MAYRITKKCTACGMCINKCPNHAIYVTNTNVYAIDPTLCTECIDLPRQCCRAVCSSRAIELDPDHRETPNELWEKRQRQRLTHNQWNPR